MDDHEVARSVVLTSSRDLLRTGTDVSRPELAATLVRVGGALLVRVARARPADGLLAAATRDDPRRLEQDRVWIADPLDAPADFPAGTDWGVHLALWQRGRLTAGAVALPARGLLLATAPAVAPGGPRWSAGDPDRARTIAIRADRVTALVRRVAERTGARLLPRRSTGATIASVLLGDADASIDPTGVAEWSSAGPVAVAVAAGISASRLDGSPVTYNRPDAVLPDLLVCRPAVRAGLLAALRGED